jgi:thioredoxin 1
MIYFSAKWCSPCKSFGPTVDTVAAMTPNLEYYKIDVDNNSEMASKYQISSVPTIVLERFGSVVAKKTGAMPASALMQMIQSNA